MPRSTTSVQAEIDVLEAFLGSAESTVEVQSANGTSATRVNRMEAAKRLDRLYVMLDRANGTEPMQVRGRIDGMGLVQT